MTKSVGETFGLYTDPLKYIASPQLVDNTRVGIEIEMEGFKFWSTTDSLKLQPWWKITVDNSLRDYGKEFILGGQAPLFGVDIVDGLEKLEKVLSGYKELYGGASVSKRTSLHCHVDVRDLNTEELKVFITLLYIFEDTFFHAYSPDRYKNNYCMPFSQNKGIQLNFSKLLEDDIFIPQVINKSAKYSASNINSIAHKGSIELRMLQATYKSEEILGWINLILSIRVYAKKVASSFNISNLPSNISTQGIIKWAEEIFGDYIAPIKDSLLSSRLLKSIRAVEHMINLETIENVNRNFVRQGVRSTKMVDKIDLISEED